MKSTKPAVGKTIAQHMKYPKYNAQAGMDDGAVLTPSALTKILREGEPETISHAPPEIVEFLNLEDNTQNVNSIVDIDEPLFQPYPMQVIFREYEQFGTYKTQLYFRNNDAVARRLKVQPLQCEVFSVTGPRPSKKGQALKNGKVAAGMEVCFDVTFKPQEKKQYHQDLILITEREKFIVPLKASGTFAALDFPDQIDFGICPVKAKNSKVVIVRNVGTRASNFVFSTTAPYSIVPSEAFVEVNATLQVEIQFLAHSTAADLSAELFITDDCGNQCASFLHGEAENVHVHLGQPTITCDPAYISLCSRKTIKLYNRSDRPVKFEWKGFQTEGEEGNERSRLMDELSKMQMGELQLLNESDWDAQSDDSLSDDDGMGECPAKRAELAKLKRKYKNLHKAVEEDKMRFADDSFELEPMSGDIWANSEIEITVSFRPHTAAHYSCRAYVDIVGREDRLSLQLLGTGIGPKAALSYDVLDIGDVFVNSVHKYEITLQNNGDIDANYELTPSTTAFGPKFNFLPDRGCLTVSDSHTFEVTFCSEILGEFSEHFHFKLQGSDDPLSVHFKGHVVGPTFHFDVDEIQYGNVSFDFLHKRVFNLVNTSEIPMKFDLRVPQDGNFVHKEFIIEPSCGIVQPNQRQKVQLDFIPTNVKKYDYYLTVDVEGVGEGLLSVPVTAECFVSDVALSADEIKYDECFMRYPFVRELVLENKSELRAKFEVVDQDERSQAVAAFKATPSKGSIDANKTTIIRVELVCEKLGQIRLPVNVKIVGSSDLPLMATINAIGIGPRVSLNKKDVGWGNIACLLDHDQTITLKNESLIPAPFKATVKNTRSKFSVDVREGTLEAGKELDLTLTANLDDILSHSDQLQIAISEGDNLVVPLTARGTGTTMYCKDDLSCIDFKHQFTTRPCEWECVLENKGRRNQTLNWVNVTAKEKDAAFKKLQQANKLAGGKDSKKKRNRKGEDPADFAAVFSVTPESIELRPRTACTFVFKGQFGKKGLMEEMLICETKVGTEKTIRTAFKTKLCADFINPLLEPDNSKLNFDYTYSPDVPIAVQTKPLTLTNSSELPLNFLLKVLQPFTVSKTECFLEPKAAMTVDVEFDPGYKNDQMSHVVNSKLVAVYKEHPQKDHIDLIGNIMFPNLEFGFDRVDFGCILNDTTKSMSVSVTNTSSVDCHFQWAFVEDEDEAQTGASSKKPYIPINQVFDILPIRGLLAPGETDEIEFMFYGHANRKFKGLVVCEVEGGPEYEMGLLGEASNIGYRLDRHHLDFGQLLYDKAEEKEFSIVNTGKVSFNFQVNLDLISRKGVVEISPMSGKVFANDRQRIIVRFEAGIPERIVETLMFEIAHFLPVEFKVYGHGVYAAIALSLPRAESDSLALPAPPTSVEATNSSFAESVSWSELLEEARDLLVNREENDSIVPPLPPSNAPGVTSTNTLGLGGGTSRPGSRLTNTSHSTAATRVQTNDGRNSPKSPTPHSVGEAAAEKAMTAPSSSANGESKDSDPRLAQTEGAEVPVVQVTDVEIETEASRLYFKRYLLATGVQPSMAAATMKSEVTDTEATAPVATTTKKSTKKGKENRFVISSHIVDFSNVVSGTSRTKKFRLTNTGHVPVSFQADKFLASSHGFMMDPEKIVRLPEGESIDFTVVFQAKKNIPLGPVEVQLPLDVKNGPVVAIALKANVTVPDVSVSCDNLDFGKVVVGQGKVITVQLCNTSPVASEWAFKKPMTNAKDLSFFKFSPPSGTLQPGERANVSVEFTPREGRPFFLKIPIKIVQNPKQHTVVCKGEGSELKLSFSPSYLDMGPLLPYAIPHESTVTVHNESDVDIEMFSLDFDPTYLQEEAILAKVGGYDNNSVRRLPIRECAGGLPDVIVAEHDAMVQEEQRLKDLEEKEKADAEMAENGDAEITTAEDAVGSEDAVGVAEQESYQQVETVRSKDGAVDIICLCPPVVDVGSSQARALATKYHSLLVRSFDDVVAEALEEMVDGVGRVVRKALDQLTETEAAEDAAAEKAAMKGKKGKKDAPVATGEDATLTDEVLTQILQWKIASTSWGNGIVFEGLRSTYASEELLASVIAQVLPESILFDLDMSSETYAEQLDGMKLRANGDLESAQGVLDELATSEKEASEKAAEEGGAPVDSGVLENAAATSTEDLNEEAAVAGEFTELGTEELVELDDEGRAAYEARRIEDMKLKETEEMLKLKEAALTTLKVLAEKFGEDDRAIEAAFSAHLDVSRACAAHFKPATEVESGCVEGNDGEDVAEGSSPTDEGNAQEDGTGDPSPSTEVPAEGEVTDTGDGAVVKTTRFFSASIEGGEGSVSAEIFKDMPVPFHERPEPPLEIPPPFAHFLQKRPYARHPRKGVTNFKIIRIPESNGEEDSTDENTVEVAAEITNEIDDNANASMRWVIPQGGSATFIVQFSSKVVGKYDSLLGFEIVGLQKEFHLVASGICTVPMINGDPRNVFMNRVKGRAEGKMVSKKYVMSRGVFEFGPLLAGRESKTYIIPPSEDGGDPVEPATDFTQIRKSNSEVFRISNVGKTACQVDFGFEIDPARHAGVEPTATDSKGKGKKAAAAGEGEYLPPFIIQPESLELDVDQTQEVRVWAFPQTAKLYDDALIACIQDNPEPIRFQITCMGSLPVLEFAGPWDAQYKSALEDAEGVANEKEKAKVIAQAEDELAKGVIDFDRLLLGRSEEREFTMTNTSAISVAWMLDIEELSKISEIEIEPSEGVLPPGGACKIVVNFSAKDEKDVYETFKVKFSDTEGGLDIEERIISKDLAIKAEAYGISCCAFEEEDGTNDGVLDFKVQRVGIDASENFAVKNKGKYDVRFQFKIRRALARELYTVEPMEGIIPAGGKVDVAVNFSCKREVVLKDNKDIICSIYEANVVNSSAAAVYDEFSVTTNVRSVFNRFVVQPRAGVNFGAVRFNEDPTKRKLEIRNEGEFEFQFHISDSAASAAFALPTDDEGKLLAPDTSPLELGQFLLSPRGGLVGPGDKMEVDMTFTPSGAELFRHALKVSINGCEPTLESPQSAAIGGESTADKCGGIIYEIVGESCFPGVNNTNFDEIFEEQSVMGSLAAANSGASSGQRVFGEQEGVFSFGSVVPSSFPNGVPEKFKISNPNKVRANVKFKIDSNEAKDANIFTVQPSEFDIPSHEHRYVTVYFQPQAMQTYKATFVAEVGDTDPSCSGKLLQFGLAGDGIFPCVTVTKPSPHGTDDANVLMDFGDLQVGKEKTMPLELHNDGVVPATCLFSMTASPLFHFSHRGGSITIPPKGVETLQVTFKPLSDPKAGDEVSKTETSCEIKMSVQHNQYEDTLLTCKGTVKKEMMTFEALPDNRFDELIFGDADLSDEAGQQVSFTLQSHASSHMRYEFVADDNFTFLPSVGHLLPKSTIDVVGTFLPKNSEVAVQFKDHPLDVKLQCFKYTSEEDKASAAEDGEVWNNSRTVVSWDGEEKQESVIPEPTIEEIDPKSKVTLKCTATADLPAYECATKVVAFRPTLMFQTRSFKFSVVNKSKSRMPISWNIMSMGLSRPTTAKAAPIPCPFTVEPAECVIKGSTSDAESSQVFTLRFCPQEVEDFNYKLMANIPGLHADTPPLVIPLQGKAQRPVCHFELEPCNYLSTRSADLPGPNGEVGRLDPSVRVLQMQSLGTLVKNTKRFYAVNPMNVGYDFQWEPVGAAQPAFRCTSMRGMMVAGKRTEMVFEYTPSEVGLHESFWQFRIPSQGINQLFLIVGSVVEPHVTLDRTRIEFPAVLLGRSATETVHLVNHEHIPFNFNFDRASFDTGALVGGGKKPTLDVHPVSGTIPPNGRKAIEVTFRPEEEKMHNFNIISHIRRKPGKLSLNVKGEGYAVQSKVNLVDLSGETTSLVAGGSTMNYVDFGGVFLNEKVQKTIVISNSGKFNFDYSLVSKGELEFESDFGNSKTLSISPASGSVKKGERVEVVITFQPLLEMVLDGQQLQLTVAGNLVFPLALVGRGQQPGLSFSFMSHDFGPCFVASLGSPAQPETAVLRVTNHEVDTELSLDCMFEKKAHLQVNCAPTVLGPNEAMEIPFVFTARELKQYQDVVQFMVNGVTPVKLVVMGEGATAKIELATPAMQSVAFGSLQVGASAARQVRVINRSKRPATFQLKDPEGAGKGRLEEVGVTFVPTQPVTLKPNESTTVEIKFSPFSRIAPFLEVCNIEVAGSEQKLLTVSGAAQGMEVGFETDSLPFGPVCVNSQLLKRLQMKNTGDIAARYKWDSAAFQPHFSVEPKEGILAPNSDIKFEIMFSPTQIEEDIRYENLCCYLEGADPIHLTLTGAGVKQPEGSSSEIQFEAAARQIDTKSITMKNPTGKPWKLTPTLQGEYWTTQEVVEIPANGSTDVLITYKPLLMTLEEGSEHKGSLFFALPDGNATSYELVGKAVEPLKEDTIAMETPAKKPLAIRLPVSNWLRQSQRFDVKFDFSGKLDSTVIDGAQSIEVGAGSSRDYAIKFYTYKAGVTSGKVTFVNSKTGEFKWFEVNVTAVSPGSFEAINLDSVVRQTAKHTLLIENPLLPSEEITLESPKDGKWWTCDNPYIRVTEVIPLTGNAEGSFLVEYRPLLPTKPLSASSDGESDEYSGNSATLRIFVDKLGEYVYTLNLKTAPAGTEKSVSLMTSLGCSSTETIRFTSFVQGVATDFACSVSRPEFFEVASVKKVDPAKDWDGQTFSVDVVYEPEMLGDVKDVLVLTSKAGGTYKCDLLGTCSPALPQGPFKMNAGASAEISFKNIFNESQQFTFVTDKGSFDVSDANASIPSKQSKTVKVTFKPGDGPKEQSGKMLVSCKNMPDVPPWVFYLNGSS